MATSLRARIIRLAQENPDLRPHLLLVLREASVKFDTSRYDLTDSVKDSAYGTWVFQMGDPAKGEHFTVRASPYRDAKHQAEAEARRRGVHEVIVLP